MRASVAVSIVALLATAGAVWYFGAAPISRLGGQSRRQTSGPGPAVRGQHIGETAPDDLPGLAAFLNKLTLEERAQFIREKVASLSADRPADREKIRAFLLSGADVEIERPSRMPSRLSLGNTSLRRYLLALVENFPPAEGIALAKAVLEKTTDFRESYLCLRALEKFQPGANRDETAAAMERTLAAAAHPVRGREVEAYIAQYDRIAEPLAHYALADLHPQMMRVLQANPTMAGRYTQAVEAFPAGQQARIYTELFAQPAIAQELIGGTGTRSVDVWLSPTFRQQAARLFSAGMNDVNRQIFINSLAEENGLHFTPQPLTQANQPQLQPTDPEKDIASAKARLAMLDSIASQATTDATKSAVKESRAAIEEEIAATAEVRPKRLSPVNLPIPDAFGNPAGAIDLPKDTTTNTAPSGAQGSGIPTSGNN